jgi:hypothetical protein
MGMLLVVAVLIALAMLIALFVHALRSDPKSRHGWLIAVPLIIIFGWVLEELIMSPASAH